MFSLWKRLRLQCSKICEMFLSLFPVASNYMVASACNLGTRRLAGTTRIVSDFCDWFECLVCMEIVKTAVHFSTPVTMNGWLSYDDDEIG